MQIETSPIPECNLTDGADAVRSARRADAGELPGRRVAADAPRSLSEIPSRFRSMSELRRQQQR